MNGQAFADGFPTLEVDLGVRPALLRLGGVLRIRHLPELETLGRGAAAQIAAGKPAEGIVLDMSQIHGLDTAGAWFVLSLARRLEAEGGAVRFAGLSARWQGLLDTVEASLPGAAPQPGRPGFICWLEHIGEATSGAWRTCVEMSNLLGEIIVRCVGLLFNPLRLRWTALIHHMQAVGFDAVPIVSLMAFLIGVVLAFQGAVQLRQFGAEIFVVDLIAISILRELGILLTAIIVAGRSASAFTAAIGSMKMREEIDAMRTLGLDPVSVLIVPRVLALVIMLPILGFIADLAGLIGGALMSWITLGVSPAMFVARPWDDTDVWQFVIGMVKAPFFALTIALVGCYEGLKVEGNAESLGARTSRSVVEAIFLVIVLDAVFSIFFALVGK